ncbi:hypothetical protein GCM10010441_44680 [Kitasatospora paracochleata]|uniref:Uncharacterized protein n=1 Tax=Kitasatospora paracochleata TaxID=58354 RepID=A0ABT1J9C1_9ACTN|nr:hypothetical protein [Kitasatospora paracochleata]MCP2314045.1 hypothetical protein [Kitasatospora paracochleata]
MSKPNWMAARLGVKRTPEPLAQLLELGRWLDDPSRRYAWRAARKERSAAVTDADRAYHDGRRPSLRTKAARIADLHEQLELAQGRACLLLLVEEFAEQMRLRITATVHRPDPVQNDPQHLELLAARIDASTRELLAALAADFIYPDEAHRSAEAALGELLSPQQAVETTGAPASLSRWADQIEFALTVVQTASTRA